jgi:2-methylcitrate dehydratase PrpD
VTTVLDNFVRQLLDPVAAEQLTDIEARLDLHITDSIGAWLAGQASSEGRAMAGTAGDGAPALFDAGFAGRIGLAVAQTRLTEIDDIHMPSCTTAGSVVVPAVLTLAAELGSDHATIRHAMRAGYDALVRTGCAIDGARILYRGIWPTYFAAPMGTAAAAAVLLGLDEERTAHALAMALVQTSGAAGGPAPGRNPRWLFAGWAAMAGVQAAVAAAHGHGGDTALLDGDWLEKTHGIAFDTQALQGEPGATLLAMSMKPACTAKQAASALAGFQQLLAEGPGYEALKSATIHVPPAYFNMISRQPPGRLGRIVSAKWQCAMSALYPDELLDIERTDHSGEPAFAALMEKISIAEDEALMDHFPRVYPARIEVEYLDGLTASVLVTNAPGDPALPLGPDALDAKFQTVATRTYGHEKAQQLFAQIRSFLQGSVSANELVAGIRTSIDG